MDRTAATAVAVAAVLAVGIAGATVGFGAVGAQDDAPDDDRSATPDRSITVTGQGSAEAPPDRAVLAVAVVAAGDDPAAVRDDLATGAEALRAALSNASVADEAVDTTEFHIAERDRPPYGPADGPDDDEPDYRGVHAFRVTVDDVDRAGSVADAAAEAGADVRYVTFELSDERRAELRDVALTDAMDDARRQADTLAAAGDLQVDGVRHVDASDRPFGPVYADDAALETAAEGGTELRPDDVAVQVDVRVTYDAAETANASAGQATGADAVEAPP